MTSWIDLILVMIAVEGFGLWVLRWRTGRGPRVLLPNLLAGAMLLLAMRLALTGAPLASVGLSLFGALVAHLSDLRARWR